MAWPTRWISAQALEIAQVLSAHGVPHELIMLEHVGHQFDLTTWNKQPLPRDLRPVVLDFLRAYGMAAVSDGGVRRKGVC